jgi:hypothetical protein
MANRYWINNGGNWNDTAHWSTSSGGIGGASIPTAYDDVIINENSFTRDGEIILISGVAEIGKFDSTNLSYSITLGTNIQGFLYIAGDIIINDKIQFNGGNIDQTIIRLIGTDRHITFLGTVYHKGLDLQIFPGAVIELNSDIYLTTITLILGGTFNTNNKNITAAYIRIYDGATVNLGSSTINGATINLGSSTIICQSFYSEYPSYISNDIYIKYDSVNYPNLKNLQFASQNAESSFNNITISNSNFVEDIVISFSLAGHINTLSFIDGLYTVSFSSSTIFCDTFIGEGSDENSLILFNSFHFANETPGQWTLDSTSNVSLSYCSLENCATANNGVTYNALISNGCIDVNNNSGWVFNPEFYWVGNGGNWDDYENHWASTSGGVPGSSGGIPSEINNTNFDENSFTTTGQSITLSSSCKTRYLNFTNVTNTPNLVFTEGNFIEVYGDITLSPNMTITYNSVNSSYIIDGSQSSGFIIRKSSHLKSCGLELPHIQICRYIEVFTWDWESGKSYNLDMEIPVKIHIDNLYMIIQEHTSSESNEPGVGVDWQSYWMLIGSCPSWELEVLYLQSGEGIGDFRTVIHDNMLYMCIQEHTSSESNEPGVGVDWQSYWVSMS